MAKLPNFQEPTLNSDVIKLLHDEVVSLCQQNYSSVSGLEIDGIICISILDTKEQQVVKIHKTLKSVFAEASSKKKPRWEDYNAPSFWLQSDAEKSGKVLGGHEKSSENYSDDIDALSNLLRDTNAAINEEERTKGSAEDNASQQKSKRKRKQSRQRNIRDVIEQQEKNDAGQCGEASKEQHVTDSEIRTCNVGIPCVNPFIHHDITVKEEKVDPEYELAEHTQPKIVSVSSISCNAGPSIDDHNTQIVTKVSSLIERLIDKEIHHQVPISESRSHKSSGNEARCQSEELVNSEPTEENTANDTECDTGYKEIVVKVEKDDKNNEYSLNQEVFDGEIPGGMDSGTGENNSDSEDGPSNCAYPDRWSYRNEVMMENSNATEQEQRDSSRKSWIEMVKDNVSKYQAALMRGPKSKRKIENNNCDASVPEVQPSPIAKNASGLLALLKKPATSLPKTADILLNVHSEMSRHSRGSSVPSQGTNMVTDRSSSLSPVVKIEVDEEMSCDMYSQSDGEVSSHRNTQNEAASTSGGRQEIQRSKVAQGKLESRYPALFSHLQAKKINYGDQDQADSLVNRLPFISFQELFSHAATGTPLPKLNEATTMQLLAKARVNPFPAREKKNGTKKKTWNWKKRQVRPKDANGRILSPIPMSANSEESETFDVNVAVKKSFNKKLKKAEEDNDAEWTPDSAEIEVDSNEAVCAEGEVSDDAGTTSRRTRLSCGEKPRINFAELENSDIEMDDDEEEDEDDIKIIRLESQMKHSQSKSHKNVCIGGIACLTSGPSAVPDSFNGNTNRHDHYSISSASANSQCKCTLCGLEFNQEYRWHYHMIKVHGVSADRIKLFR